MLRILLCFSVLLSALAAPARAQDAAAALEGAWVVSVGEQKDRFLIVRGAKTEKNKVHVESTVFGWVDGRGKPVENWNAEIFGDAINLSFITPGGASLKTTFKADETSVIGDWIARNGKELPFRMTRLDEEELAAMRSAAKEAKAAQPSPGSIRKDSKIALVYVGADDCPRCRVFIARVGNDGKRLSEISPALAEARFVYISQAHFRASVTARDLPPDLAWLIQPAANGKSPLRKRGTPFFAAVVDQRVLAQGHGVAALETLVAPAIKGAVEARRAAY